MRLTGRRGAAALAAGLALLSACASKSDVDALRADVAQAQADAAEDAGKPRSAAGDRPGAEVRGDIALRRITVSVLRADRERNAAQP